MITGRNNSQSVKAVRIGGADFGDTRKSCWIYQWVDENGNIKWANAIIPSDDDILVVLDERVLGECGC